MPVLKIGKELTAIDVAKWINSHNDRKISIEIFTNIDLGYGKKTQLKEIAVKTIDDLISEDLKKSEKLTLLTTLRNYTNILEKQLKDGK